MFWVFHILVTLVGIAYISMSFASTNRGEDKIVILFSGAVLSSGWLLATCIFFIRDFLWDPCCGRVKVRIE